MTARPPHLDSLRGQGYWVGGYDAKYTSAWPSTAIETPSDAYGKLCTNDLKEDVSIYAAKMATSTHLIVSAAVLGPNHCPTSFPSSFLARDILSTLNGHGVDGGSKNHVNM